MGNQSPEGADTWKQNESRGRVRELQVEIKYDGERVQLHKIDQHTLLSYSRNLRYTTARCFSASCAAISSDFCRSRGSRATQVWKLDQVREHVLRATASADSLIADGELLVLEAGTQRALPFGTLNRHRFAELRSASVCAVLFDLMYLNGRSLLAAPLSERRALLEKHVTPIPGHVQLAEAHCVTSAGEIEALLQRAITEGQEGLMIKSRDMEYRPNARHWWKLKKDYLQGMGDTLDLVVLGAWSVISLFMNRVMCMLSRLTITEVCRWGRGAKAGLPAAFLMGCCDPADGVWRTVCRVGSGFDEAALREAHSRLAPLLRPFQPPPPDWIRLHRNLYPDLIVSDPKKYADVNIAPLCLALLSLCARQR